MAPSILQLLVAALPVAHATLPLVNHLSKRADPYPFCDPNQNPNCIDGGRYLVPILEFSNPNDKGDTAFRQSLPKHTYVTSKFRTNVWPQACQYWGVTADKFNSSDFDVYNVTYSDGCAGNPWVICYHRRSQNSLATILGWIGQIPAGVRQAASVYMAYSTDNPNYNGAIGALAGDGLIVGRNDYFFPTALVHEHGHCVDSNLISPGNGAAFSSTNDWKYAYNADYCAVSAYGAGSGVEDFAETGRAVLLDNIYPGGLKSFSNNNPNLTQISNQIRVFKSKANIYYKANTTCDPVKKYRYPPLVTRS